MRETWPCTVARIDFGRLADHDVLRLRFRDPQLRLQVAGIRDANEIGARLHLCTDLDLDHLQHTAHAGLDAEILDLAHAQLVRGATLVNFGFLRCQL